MAGASLEPNGKALARPLPPNWSITMRVRFSAPRSTLRVGLGSSAVLVFDGSHVWHHVTLSRRGLLVDGRRTGASPLEASSVTLRALHGGVAIRSLMIKGSKR